MISITISSDQIRTAPAEVRRWIESEVAAAMGLQAPRASAQGRGEQLAVCTLEEASAILSLIHGVLPAVNVFFELGHQGIACGQGELEAYRLRDLLHRTRLGNVEQVVMYLDMINEALRRVRGTTEIAFYGLDDEGHCFIAAQTQQSIGTLWRRLVDGSQALGEDATRPSFGVGPRSPGDEGNSATAAEPSLQLQGDKQG